MGSVQARTQIESTRGGSRWRRVSSGPIFEMQIRRPPPCEMFFDAESLGRAGTTGIQGWCGTGTLLVLISRMNPSFPRMVTIAWSTGEEAVIKDVDLEAPCTLQRPGRPRWLGSHEGA